MAGVADGLALMGWPGSAVVGGVVAPLAEPEAAPAAAGIAAQAPLAQIPEAVEGVAGAVVAPQGGGAVDRGAVLAVEGGHGGVGEAAIEPVDPGAGRQSVAIVEILAIGGVKVGIKQAELVPAAAGEQKGGESVGAGQQRQELGPAGIDALDGLAVRAQAELVGCHELVLGPHGAGFTHLLFAGQAPQRALKLIAEGNGSFTFALILGRLELDHTVHVGTEVQRDNGQNQPVLRVLMEAVLALLRP